MNLVPVKSLTEAKQLTYGDLEPDDWFSRIDHKLPEFYKTSVGYAHCSDGSHVEGFRSLLFKPDTPVRIYKVEVRYEAVE
jgi:hypothetical protein